MNLPFDTLIVGGGLAGACAALYLSRQERVLLLEADRPSAGASGAAAGLVNPLMALRARPVWHMEEALEALAETLDLADARPLFRACGVLRPAADVRQAGFFNEAAARHAAHADWLPPTEAKVRYGIVAAPYGALRVRSGGAVSVPALVEALLAAARGNGAFVRTGQRVTGWGETRRAAYVQAQHGTETARFHAGRVLLALGGTYVRFPELAALRLHRVKGQTVRVAGDGFPEELPPLAGQGYVIPEAHALVVGSSYEHTFTDLRPSPEQTRRILRKAASMLPGLEAAAVLEETAGVRVTVPGVRLPMLGPLPNRERLWIFTGLGAKGLLMAPLLARRLPQFFSAPETIPPKVQVRMR